MKWGGEIEVEGARATDVGVGDTGFISVRLTYETPRDLLAETLKSTKPALNSDLIGANCNL